MVLLMMSTVVRIVEMLTKILSRMFTVVREEEIREAAEERPQAGQEAVAVPDDHEDHEQLVVKMVTKII